MVPETNLPIKKHSGGPDTHKPGCICRACAARRRQAEAIALTAGAGGTALATRKGSQKALGKVLGKVLEADFIASGISPRDRVAQWLLLRQQEPGIKTSEIAKRLGISPNTLYSILVRARKEGWLKFDDPLSRIEYEIVPKVLDNMSLFLDQKDKQVTIEAFKATAAKQYQESKGVAEAPHTFVAIKIEAPDPDHLKVITGQIVGRPRE